ncbi:transposable element Tc1 transposase [Trichonephila clavipes]|nr:transposable element Tc1 transposase [Trichonephila clavipes]
MPPRRNKEKYQQLTEFERRRIISLRERGFSYRTIGARVQRNSSTVTVWKQWTDEHRKTRKTSSGRRKVTSALNNRHLLRMAVNVRTTSSRQIPSRQTINGCVCNGLMSRVWQAYWHQVVFSDESRFNLRDYDGPIHVRRYAGERFLPECVIEQNSGLTPGFMV